MIFHTIGLPINATIKALKDCQLWVFVRPLYRVRIASKVLSFATVIFLWERAPLTSSNATIHRPPCLAPQPRRALWGHVPKAPYVNTYPIILAIIKTKKNSLQYHTIVLPIIATIKARQIKVFPLQIWLLLYRFPIAVSPVIALP